MTKTEQLRSRLKELHKDGSDIPIEKTEQIRSRLKELLKDGSDIPIENVPIYLSALDWIGFALHYNEAANVLGGRVAPVCELPRLLLAGHATECALKACLVAKGKDTPHIHDLVKLTDKVLENGYRIRETDLVVIVNLNSRFSEDLASGTKYRVRYPTMNVEAGLGDGPQQMLISHIVESLVDQATSVNQYLNRHAWSGVEPNA